MFRKRLPAKNVIIYGLQRSGTNYLETMLQLNYPDIRIVNGIERHKPSHKHFRLYPEKNIIPEPQFDNTLYTADFNQFAAQLPVQPDIYIIVSKDPYSWLISYERWSKKNNWPPHQHHYSQEYDLFYSMWMHYAGQTDKILFVRYDDLLKQPDAIIGNIGAMLQYPKLPAIAIPKKVYASRRFSKSKKDAHLSGASKRELPEADKQAVQQNIRPALMTYMGYQYL